MSSSTATMTEGAGATIGSEDHRDYVTMSIGRRCSASRS